MEDMLEDSKEMPKANEMSLEARESYKMSIQSNVKLNTSYRTQKALEITSKLIN